MNAQIKHRFTGAVIYECEAPEESSGLAIRYAIESAMKSGANLSGANLYGANLYGANLDGEKLSQTPISLTGMRWPVLISDGYMRIGCQRHTHTDCAAFGDETIADMDGDAAEFWTQWKAPLLAMCEAHAEQANAKKEKQ